MNFICDFVLYNALGFTIGTTTFLTLEYINDPENFSKNIKKHSYSILGWSIDRFLEYKVTFDEKIKPHIDEFIQTSKNKEINKSYEPEVIITENNQYMSIIIDDKLYYFNMYLNREIDPENDNYELSSQNSSISDSESSEHTEDIKPNINNNKDEPWDLTISKPFNSMTVLVSYNDKETEYDITEYITPFCICGNNIDTELIEIILNSHSFNYDYITNINILNKDFDLKKYNLQEPQDFDIKIKKDDLFIDN